MPNTWMDREKAYNELMRIMGQKVHRQIRVLTRYARDLSVMI